MSPSGLWTSSGADLDRAPAEMTHVESLLVCREAEHVMSRLQWYGCRGYRIRVTQALARSTPSGLQYRRYCTRPSNGCHTSGSNGPDRPCIVSRASLRLKRCRYKRQGEEREVICSLSLFQTFRLLVFFFSGDSSVFRRFHDD